MSSEKLSDKALCTDKKGQTLVLKADHLSIQFGGLKAVDDVNLSISQGELYGLIGPNGAGKTTMFNLLTGVYKPTAGRFFLCGRELTGKSPLEINRAGIARTFQNIRLFNNLTVLENVMVGMTNQIRCTMPESIFRLPRHFSAEKQFREKAYELLKVFQLEKFADYQRRTCPTESREPWRLHGQWQPIPPCFCWMSRLPV